ncbi:hypothetical protein DYB30_002616 [Aphanomyces astaci]|uniref:RRM domain-containing protein n=1 Tax=Aphanomyces astaci TaxID=112090 RepID=A0A397CFQ0_APHAT|nr:hypothetical protein DYB30_002616 [Aphanomyces astaci]
MSSPPPPTAAIAGLAPLESIRAVPEHEKGYYLPNDAEAEPTPQDPVSHSDSHSKKRKLDDEGTSDVVPPAAPHVAPHVAPTVAPPVASPVSANVPSYQTYIPTEDDVAEGKAIARLLSPFTREQIVSILISAALQHKSIYNEIRTMASVDVAHRKLFVRGLSWDTTSASLQGVFETYGKVTECTVIMDRTTGRSKGFGFVTFEDMDSAEKVLSIQPLDVDGRKCSCNLAAVPENNTNAALAIKHHIKTTPQSTYGAHPYQQQQPTYGYTPTPHAPHGHHGGGKVLYADLGPGGDENDRKLFLRGLDYNTSTESVTAEFAKYGDLEEVTIAKDRTTGKSKGFAFITYRHMGSAKRALAQPQKFIDGRATHCNLASLKQAYAPPQYGHQHQVAAPAPQVYRPPTVAAAAPQAAMGYPPQVYQQPPAAAPYLAYAPPAAAPYAQPPPQDMYRMMAQYAQQQPMQAPQAPPAPLAYYHHPRGPNAAAKPQ